MIGWRAIATAFCVAAITLLGTELIASALLGTIDFGHPYASPRNPNFRRAWLEFTRPAPRASDSELVILISNSQGFLREVEKGELAYAKQLQSRLTENASRNVQVANWSVAGGYAPEFVVLAARAATHQPDIILLVTYGRNFTSAHLEQPLAWGVSDVDLIGYQADVRAKLPDWFIQHYQLNASDKHLETWSSLIRLRSILSEPKSERWTWSLGEPKVAFHQNSLKTAGPWREMSDRLLVTLTEIVTEISPKTQIILVVMPFAEKIWHPQATHVNRFLFPRAQQLLAGNENIHIFDASRLLPSDPNLFYGHAHLRPKGHAAFADWLSPRVQAILAEQ